MNEENKAPSQEPKQAKGYASIAQIRRCEGLVTDGTVKKEDFERDLIATDIDNVPWRKGTPKEGDGDVEYLASIKKRRADLLAALPEKPSQA